MNMESINIAGQLVRLTRLEKSELKSISVDSRVRFNFFLGELRGDSLLFIQSKGRENITPLQYSGLVSKFEKAFDYPLVFIFDDLKYYERDRLLNYGVYFVVSDKYVHLPFLLINAKATTRKRSEILSPVAQYVLLLTMQNSEFKRCTHKDLEQTTSYTYATISKAVSQLEEFGLCKTEKNGRVKYILFNSDEELWWSCQSILSNPVLKLMYCNQIPSDKEYIISSYNALSFYSSLNPEERQTYAISKGEFEGNEFEGLNEIEGNITLEVWSYPPIGDKYVDKLSLVLSLQKDRDPRVEKEVKNIIKTIW